MNNTQTTTTPFPYTDIRFADIQMLRYRVPEFESLSLRQKKLIYFLSEAAIAGRDILWDQNCRFNLPIRRMLEAVYQSLSETDKENESEHTAFLEYLRRVWFANGIHHHYSMNKFRPGFSEEFLRATLQRINYPIDETLLRVIFDPEVLPKRVNLTDGEDLLRTSAMNYYAPGVTQKEAESFYADMKAAHPENHQPPMFGMNSRLERNEAGDLQEKVWKSGGMYGNLIDIIIDRLEKASEVAENEEQRHVLSTLIDFYRTGDLLTFDRYSILWVRQTEGDIDFTNGFIETYGDPLGLKASWEGYVNLKDHVASERTRKLSENAQWFEDNSPIAPRFKKTECRGISAKVVNVAMLGGDLYPASAIGINLPNSNWIRQEHGSKSVTLGNLTEAYAQAAKGNGFYEEFIIPEETSFDIRTAPSDLLDDLHTDLHECLGHGSGRLLPGVDPDGLGPYGSTIEEARADLFALYYIADVKMQELGLVPDAEAFHCQYYTYMMNGLLTQLIRIELGQQIEEAHMRNRALIARWLLKYSEAMELKKLRNATDGKDKTYLKITSYPALRQAIGRLLAEVQRIKSEGDLAAARQLVEDYGVKVDATLHREILERYRKLNLAPYKGFINPQLIPVHDADGQITDINIQYDESYDRQMLRYGRYYEQATTD